VYECVSILRCTYPQEISTSLKVQNISLMNLGIETWGQAMSAFQNGDMVT
jgi:hypothetical protein